MPGFSVNFCGCDGPPPGGGFDGPREGTGCGRFFGIGFFFAAFAYEFWFIGGVCFFGSSFLALSSRLFTPSSLLIWGFCTGGLLRSGAPLPLRSPLRPPPRPRRLSCF